MELAGFARELDEDEGARMAEGGITNPEFLRFMQVLNIVQGTENNIIYMYMYIVFLGKKLMS